MVRESMALCAIVAVLGPSLLFFFGHNLWQARTKRIIFGGPRYSPRMIARTKDPRAFKTAIVTHIVCLVPTGVITINCYVTLFRWLFGSA